jgi:hypothetical protein
VNTGCNECPRKQEKKSNKKQLRPHNKSHTKRMDHKLIPAMNEITIIITGVITKRQAYPHIYHNSIHNSLKVLSRSSIGNNSAF